MEQSFWPNGTRGAVSLTFDDGLPSQLARAMPVLDGAGLSATFYLCAGEKSINKLAPWKDVARRGHELARRG